MNITRKAASAGAAVALGVVGAATYAGATSGHSTTSTQSSVVDGKFSDASTTATPTDSATVTATDSASSATSTPTSVAPVDSTAPAPSATTSTAPSQPPTSSAPAAPSSSAAPVTATPPAQPICKTYTVTFSSDVVGSSKPGQVWWNAGGGMTYATTSGSWSHSESVQCAHSVTMGTSGGSCSISVDGAVVSSQTQTTPGLSISRNCSAQMPGPVQP